MGRVKGRMVSRVWGRVVLMLTLKASLKSKKFNFDATFVSGSMYFTMARNLILIK
jgi:hypothetical protein